MKEKARAASVSVLSNSLLIILKVITGIFTGSVSIISEAIHSFMDLLAAGIAYLSVRISDTPADDRHPYGHRKIENFSGMIEALLIFLASAWIIYEAVDKLMNPEAVHSIGIGFVVMLLSAITNLFVSRYLYKVARRTGSVALEADALHLKTDVYTSGGVAAGLLIIWFTGIPYLDPVIAILVALLILWESFSMFRKAFEPLLDVSIPEGELNIIRNILDSHSGAKIGYHNLRTRKSGHFRYIDFHLTMDDQLTVKQAHQICDIIEAEIKKVLPDSEITIHVENF